MKLDSINSIKEIIDLCRKNGVESIKIEGFELKLGEAPGPRKYTKRAQETHAHTGLPKGIITDGVTVASEESLSEEELLFWSADPSQNGN